MLGKESVYLDINLKYLGIKVKNIITKEIIKERLTLSYFYTDSNHIYLKSPLPKSSLDTFKVIFQSKDELDLKTFLIKRNFLAETYLLISNNYEILGFTDFPVNLNENYFTIPFTFKLKDFIESIGKENIKVIRGFQGYTLTQFSNQKHFNPIVTMFLTSQDNFILNHLNTLKRTYIKEKFIKQLNHKLDQGIFSLENYKFNQFTSTVQDLFWIEKALKSPQNYIFLKNNNSNYYLSREQIYNLKQKLDFNSFIWNAYQKAYFNFIDTTINNSFSLNDLLNLDPNVFCFGYTNLNIQKELLESIERNEIFNEIFKQQ